MTDFTKLNTKYVMDQLRDFTRLQRFKQTIVESAEKLNNIQHAALPIVPDLDPTRTAEQIKQSIVKIGRMSYACGFPRDHATGRFIDNDMTIYWANGWRWEQEEHAARKVKCSCAGCIRLRGTP